MDSKRQDQPIEYHQVNQEAPSQSRRSFIVNAGLAAGGVAALGAGLAATPAAAATAAAAAAPTAAAAAARDPITDKVMAIVAEQTGYPADMLDVELDLEAVVRGKKIRAPGGTWASLVEALGATPVSVGGCSRRIASGTVAPR